MKCRFLIYGISLLLLATGCSREEEVLSSDVGFWAEKGNIPDSCFIVTFRTNSINSRVANGPDSRVQHIRYLVYTAAGQFVKERILWAPADGVPNWPFNVITDTLPKGAYKAVFLGNIDSTLFSYTSPGPVTDYSNVLTDYRNGYSSARINLPNVEFSDNTEYYWANVSFSDQQPSVNVILQRIIGLLNVHRNVVDAQQALDSLVSNIVTQLNYKNLIRTTVSGVLNTGLTSIIGPLGAIVLLPLGGVDAVVNVLLGALVNPVVDTLYNALLQQLVHKIGVALAGNEDQAGLLGVLGELLNPWEFSQAHTAIVDINNFPKSIDFDLVLRESYPGVQRFRYDFTSDAFFAQKCLHIKGFAGTYDIRKVNVVKAGLVSGLLVDQVIEGSLLLDGAFIDINDPLSAGIPANIRKKADYSFLDLGLKSYTAQTDGNHSLTLSTKIGDIANIDGILGGIPLISGILSFILTPIKNITVSVPVNLPLLGIDNLQLSGGWSTPTNY